MKKKVIVEGPHSKFELWVPDIETALNKEGGSKMQEFNKVKSFRVGAGITLEQMADALGISKPTYMARENGTSDFKLTEMNTFTETINKATGQNYSVKDIFF